jgi:hypothetical protein
MGAREERIGLNEAVFREVNERIENVAEILAPNTEQLDLVCECGNAACEERISMTMAEYEALRSESHLFAVYPGHEYPDVERVVEKRKGYDVVQKFKGAPERIAEETDPRKPE